MLTGTSHSFLWTYLMAVACARLPVSEGQKMITAESGQNVTLTCRAPNKDILVVEWSRADLGDEYVLLYRDKRFISANQHTSFKNRVDLQDKQMKDGDVSLIVKDVRTVDSGTFECRVALGGTNHRKRAILKTDPISIIYLHVVPPGQTGGDTEDGGKEEGGKEEGGKEDGGKEDGGKEDGGKRDGGKEDGSVGLVIGLSVVAVAVVFSAAVALFLIYRKHKQCNQDSHRPPAEPQIEMSESFLN